MTNDVGEDQEIETRLVEGGAKEPLLLQIRSDRRLGHEWDDWDGNPLPDNGVFDARETIFFKIAVLVGLLAGVGSWLTVWLIEPRLGLLWTPLSRYLTQAILIASVLW